jgi:biopolymer transport protein ExbD
MIQQIQIPEEEADEPDLAPMVDMVFLLLIFFMVSSHLNQMDKIEVDLPVESHAAVAEEMRDRRTITIQSDGTIFLGTTRSSLAEVGPVVKKELAVVKNLKIYIRADRGVQYKEVEDVMKACSQAGASEILFAAYESP